MGRDTAEFVADGKLLFKSKNEAQFFQMNTYTSHRNPIYKLQQQIILDKKRIHKILDSTKKKKKHKTPLNFELIGWADLVFPTERALEQREAELKSKKKTKAKKEVLISQPSSVSLNQFDDNADAKKLLDNNVIYPLSKYTDSCHPTCLFLPSELQMLLIMRACLHVTELKDLAFYENIDGFSIKRIKQ